MDSAALRAAQQPLKDAYRDDPQQAVVTLQAQGTLGDEEVSCSVSTGAAMAVAGLHPATGGDGSLACSGDMLLQALVACAGVTLRAVATSLELSVRAGTVRAEGDLDFDASDDQIATLLRLTERYCVVYQTLAQPARLSAAISRTSL
jgi:uncharacterized OsmC-like protein